MITARVLLLIVALSDSAPSAPLRCGGLEVRVSARDPIQGEIVQVEVSGAGSDAPAARWRGEPVRFWREEASGAWRALVGVDVEQACEPAELVVTPETGGACGVSLEIRPGAFGEKRLTLPPRYVELSPRNRARVEREAERLDAIFAMRSDRMWDGAFRLPIDGDPAPNFGQKRILNGVPRSPHAGVDFGARSGTRVRAAARGRVALASSLFLSGRTVVLDHGLGLFSFYAHLSSIAVRAGQTVAPGTVLGGVGATGRATGPHLHWSARLAGARVDPRELLRAWP